MAQKPAVALRDHVASLPEPRIARQRWPKLSDMLVSAGCAVLGGAESCPASADCGHEREEGLRHFLELPEGMPSHDPCKRVVRLVDPVQFQACFLSGRHAGAEVTPGEVVASEGKARRRSCEQGRAKRAIPLVRAWATANGGVLGPRTGGGAIEREYRYARVTGSPGAQRG